MFGEGEIQCALWVTAWGTRVQGKASLRKFCLGSKLKGERALSREAWCVWESVQAGPAARAEALRQQELRPAKEMREGCRGPACGEVQLRSGGNRVVQGCGGHRLELGQWARGVTIGVAVGSSKERHRGSGEGGRGAAGGAPPRSEPTPLPAPTCSRGACAQRTLTPPLPVCVPSAGYLPNSVHAVEAMLAAASIGAIWSSASADFGVKVSPGPHQRGRFRAPRASWACGHRRAAFCEVSAGKGRAHLRPWVGRVGRGSQWTCVASETGRK